MAYSAHITDKLLAGMYSTPDNSQQPVQLLPSGTPVELINEKNGFVQVQLVDGKTGWVEKRFLSEEKPANVRLLALQSKYRQLQEKLDRAEQQLSTLTSPQEQQQVKALQTALATAEKTIVSLEEDVKQFAETKNKTTGSDHTAAVQLSSPKSEQQVGDSYWWVVLLVAAGAIITGAYTGIRIQDRRQRNRHGGFRV